MKNNTKAGSINHLSWIASAMGAAALLASSAAGALSYTGTFVNDDDIFIAYAPGATGLPATFTGSGSSQTEVPELHITGTSTVTIRTWSWGGGTNGAGSSIAPGGLGPVVALFEASGAQTLLQQSTTGGALSCGPGANPDPASTFCWDSYISISLPAGDYLVTLTQDDNSFGGSSFDLGSGWVHGIDGANNFSGGPFIEVGTFQRDGHWALDIDIEGTAAPLPATALLMLASLAGIGSLRRLQRER